MLWPRVIGSSHTRLPLAEILERELTGLDLTREAEIKKRTSVIAPPPAEHLEKLLSFRKVPYTSGLDAVIVLSIGSEDVAIKRALGRRVDPETGNVYHLDLLLTDPSS